MFYNTSNFYFATTRKIIISFGSLFTNIKVHRYSENGNSGQILKSIPVPIGYGPAEKWIRLSREKRIPKGNSPKEKTRIKITLPRISFELLDFQYNPERKLQTLIYNTSTQLDNMDIKQVLRQLNPVPYDFSFSLNILVKDHDQAFQIIEQILPNFAPSVNLNVKDIPELDPSIVRDIPVTLAGISKQDSFEGIAEEDRVIIYTLTFVAKAYLYPVITDAEVIKKITATIYPTKSMQEPSTADINVYIDPLSAEVDDDYDIITEIDENE